MREAAIAERAYGLVAKSTFSDAWDDARKPLRIPLPSRTATTEAQSVYRAHVGDGSIGYRRSDAGPWLSDGG